MESKCTADIQVHVVEKVLYWVGRNVRSCFTLTAYRKPKRKKKKKENPNEVFSQPSTYLFRSGMPTVSADARVSLFSLDMPIGASL